MDLAQRRRLIILIEVALGTLIAAIVTVVIIRSQRDEAGQKCAPSNRLPLLNMDTLKNVASDDNRSLVALSGYLKFADSNGANSYLPIGVESVVLSAGARGGQELRVRSACVKVMLRLHRSGRIVELESVHVGRQGDSLFRSCSTGPTGIYFGQDSSYVCYSKQALPCYEFDINRTSGEQLERGPKVADLVLEALRLEINGNPANISRANFSKPAHFCF